MSSKNYEEKELEILRSILIVADSCEEIVNYIDKSSGDDLLSSLKNCGIFVSYLKL